MRRMPYSLAGLEIQTSFKQANSKQQMAFRSRWADFQTVKLHRNAALQESAVRKIPNLKLAKQAVRK